MRAVFECVQGEERKYTFYGLDLVAGKVRAFGRGKGAWGGVDALMIGRPILEW